MAPIRRARSVPEDLRRETHQLSEVKSSQTNTVDNNTTPEAPIPEDRLSRLNIRRIVMSTEANLTMTAGGAPLLAIRIIRIVQIALGPVLIGLSAALLVRYQDLNSTCRDPDSFDCEIYRKMVGTLKYCVVPGIIVLIEGIWGLIASYMKFCPLWWVTVSDGITAGFLMGGGCSLAAILNGWKCDEGADAGQRMCPTLYASIAMFFLGVVVAYSAIPIWCWARASRKRNT